MKNAECGAIQCGVSTLRSAPPSAVLLRRTGATEDGRNAELEEEIHFSGFCSYLHIFSLYQI